jgi:hypothetical protein
LEDRLGATAEEIAAWVYFAPPSHPRPKRNSRVAELVQSPAWGGLSAYSDAGEFDDPPRFFFDWELHGDDYLKPLAACWFKAQDIAAFQPIDRYITAGALIERWRNEVGDDVDSVIENCILQSRLHDIHPTRVVTQWSKPDAPPRESALFSLTEIETIENEDGIPVPAVDAPPAPEQAKSKGENDSLKITNWKLQVQAEAVRMFLKLRAMGCKPTKNSIKDDLAKWCVDKGVKTKSLSHPSAEYIYRHALREWTPPD